MNKIRARLLEKANQAKRNSYSPYSKFKVGAAVQSETGKIFSGCNVENSSYGLSMCAERVALFKAVSEGHKKIKSIAIASSGKHPTFPCGACRQVLVEFNPDMLVFIDGDSSNYVVSELLTKSFSKKQLK